MTLSRKFNLVHQTVSLQERVEFGDKIMVKWERAGYIFHVCIMLCASCRFGRHLSKRTECERERREEEERRKKEEDEKRLEEERQRRRWVHPS